MTDKPPKLMKEVAGLALEVEIKKCIHYEFNCRGSGIVNIL